MISESIKAKGYDATEPIIYGRIDSAEGDAEEGIVDGYQRCAGAGQAGRPEGWVQEIQFDCLQEAIAFAMSRHRLRRKAGDGEILYALCAREHLLTPHGGNTRRKLLRSLLRVGSATIDKSGHRPKLAVVCPWHPLRMEAFTARNHQLLGTISQSTRQRTFHLWSWHASNG